MKVYYPGPSVDPAVALTRQTSHRFGVELQCVPGPDGKPVPTIVDLADEDAAAGLAAGLFAPGPGAPAAAAEAPTASMDQPRRSRGAVPPSTATDATPTPSAGDKPASTT